MSLEFRLLGDVAVLADGRPLDVGGARQRSVLALLMLQRNRSVTTEPLADRLWPDDQPLGALKTVQVYVSRLRRSLGSHAHRLTSSPTGYRLTVANDELDAARFEHGLRQAREMLVAGSASAAETAIAILQDALGLWSGPALGALGAERFARREAERLEELRIQACEELFEIQIAAGSGRETIGELRRLLADQPGRERLWRLLMVALYADDRQGEALAAYQDARRYLADELGVDPSPELQHLERAILTQEAPRPRQFMLGASVAVNDAFEPGAHLEAEIGVQAGGRRRRIVTVLRADVVRASEDAVDPEVLEVLAGRTAAVARQAVERHGGTIDRADHEGVTAVFGLAVAREDDALRAVRAAFELANDADSSQTRTVVLRAGVATGEVLASTSLASGPMLTGAPLQLAARLASRAGPREVLVASETAELVAGATSTERVAPESDDDAAHFSAMRLLALTDSEAIVRRTTTRFVGRPAELEALRVAFEGRGSEAGPGLVTVIGAPGVGKSRLVAEALARISKDTRILRARCLPYGDGITYLPIRDLVVASAGIEPADTRDEACTKLRALFAGLDREEADATRIASIAGFADDPVPSEEIPWAVRRFFEALAAERQLVVLIDDLQWAQPALVDLVEHLLDLGHGAILVVAIARPEFADERPEWLARSNRAFIRLDALGDTEAAVLLDQLAPDLPSGPRRSRILAAADGNPLFIEQFIAYAADETGDLTIPPTIEALLAARLDRLPDVERRLLERAAVIGRTFWVEALVEGIPEPKRADVHRRLARLARRGLIRPEHSDVRDDEAFRFRHLLIRDAAYASLPKRERAELHQRFADLLDGRSGRDPADSQLIVAYHLEQAYRYRLEFGDDRSELQALASRALALLGPAGRAAEERGDPHAAISLLRRAIDLSPSDYERIDLLIALRAALWTAGDRDASEAAASEAAVLLAEHPDKGLEHRRRLTEARFGGPITIPDTEAAFAHYERVGDVMGMIRALEVAVSLHEYEDRWTAALETLERAIALAIRLGAPDRAVTVAARSAWIFYYSPLPVPEALARLHQFLEMATTSEYARALILMELGRLEAQNGIRDKWRLNFDAAKEIIDDLGLLVPLGVAMYPQKLGATELAAGNPARVVEMLRESCSTLDRLGLMGPLSAMASITSEVLLALGRPDEAERFACWGRDTANPDAPDLQVDWRMAMAGVRSRQGRHEAAGALVREALAIIPSGSEDYAYLGKAWMLLAGVLRAAGEEPAAQEAALEARRLAAAKEDRTALRKIGAFLQAAARTAPAR